GPLRDQEVPAAMQEAFERFTLASHDAAVGSWLSGAEARAVIATRISAMARGNSGASPAVFDGLVALLERDVIPVLSREGSVGSADLALLAAVGRVLLGQGRVLNDREGESVPGAQALAEADLAPIHLGPKDA